MKSIFKPMFALACAGVLLTTVFSNANANVQPVSAQKVNLKATTALNKAVAVKADDESDFWGLISSAWVLAGPGVPKVD